MCTFCNFSWWLIATFWKMCSFHLQERWPRSLQTHQYNPLISSSITPTSRQHIPVKRRNELKLYRVLHLEVGCLSNVYRKRVKTYAWYFTYKSELWDFHIRHISDVFGTAAATCLPLNGNCDWPFILRPNSTGTCRIYRRSEDPHCLYFQTQTIQTQRSRVCFTYMV
jgi:hypothetical protein